MFRGGLRYNPIEVELQDPYPVATCNGNPSSRTYVAKWCSIPVHLHVLTFVKRPNPIAPLPGPNSPHPTVAAALDAPPPVQANMVTQPDMIAIATEVETALVQLIAEPSPQVLPVLACAKVTCRAHISSPGDDHVTQRILAEVHVATPRVPGLVPLSQWLQERWPACRVEDEAAAAPGTGTGQAQGQIQGQAQGQQQRQQQPQPTAAAASISTAHAAASHATGAGAATHVHVQAPSAAAPPPRAPLPASQRHVAAVPAPAPPVPLPPKATAATAAVPVPAAPPVPLPPKATAAMALHGLEPAVGLTGPPPPPPALLAQRGASSSTSYSARTQPPPLPAAAAPAGTVAPSSRPAIGGDGSSLKHESAALTSSQLPTVAGGIAGAAPVVLDVVAAPRAGPRPLSSSTAEVSDQALAAGALSGAAGGTPDTCAQPVAEGTQPQTQALGCSSPRGFGVPTVAGAGGSMPGSGSGAGSSGPRLGSHQSGAAAFGCFGCFAGGQGSGHDSEGSGPLAAVPTGTGAKGAAPGARAVGPAGPAQPVLAGVAAGPLAPSGRAVLPPAVSRRLLAPAAGSSTGSGVATAGGGAAGGGSGGRPYGRAALPLPPPPPLQPLLPVTEALDVLICLAEVLGALHRRGLTHGAVSPKTVQLQVTAPPPEMQALLKRAYRPHGRGNRHGREQAQAQQQLTPPSQAAAAGQAKATVGDAKHQQPQQQHVGTTADALPRPAQAAEHAARRMAAAEPAASTLSGAGPAEAPAGAVTADGSGALSVPRQPSAAGSVATPTAHAAASKPASGAAAALAGGGGGPRPPALQLTQLEQGGGPTSSGGRGSNGSNGAAKQTASPFRPTMVESLADPAMAAFLDSGSTDPKSRQTLAQVVAALGGLPRTNLRGGGGGGGAGGAVGSSAAAGGSGRGGSVGGSGLTAGSASGPSGTGSMLTNLLLGSAAVKSNASASEAVMVTAALPSSILDSAAAAAAASASSARTHTGTGVLSSSEAPGPKQGLASPTPPSGRGGGGGVRGGARRRSAAAAPDSGGGGGSATECGSGSIEGHGKAEAGGAGGGGDCDADGDDKSSTQSLQLRPIVPRPPPGQTASSVTTASLARPPPQPSLLPSRGDTQQSGLPSIPQSASTPLGSTPHASSGVPHSGPDTFSQPGTSAPSQALSLPLSHATTGRSRNTATTQHENHTEGDDTIGSAGAEPTAAAVESTARAGAGAAPSRQRSSKPRRLMAMLTLPALGPAVLQMLTWGRARPVGLPRDQLMWCAPELLNTGGLGWPILPLMPRRSGSGAVGAGGATGLDPLGPLDRSLGTVRSHRMGGTTHRGRDRDRDRERDKGGNVQFSGFMSGPGAGDGSYTYGAGLNSSVGGNRRFRLAAALLMGHDPSGAASSVYGVTPSCDVYSVGLLMWHLVTGQYPFDHLSTQEVVRAKELGSLDEQLPFSPELPLAYIALARRCWSAAPMQRPAMRSVLAELRSLRCQLLGLPQPYESPGSGFGFGFGLGLGRSSSMGDFTGDSRLSFTLSLALSSRDFSCDDYALARPPLELAFGAGGGNRTEHGGSAANPSHGGSGGPPPPPSLQTALPPGLLTALTAPRTTGGGGGGGSGRRGGGSGAFIDDESDRFTDTDRFTDQAETEHSTVLSSPPTAGTPSGGGTAGMRSGSGAGGGSRRNMPSAASLTRSFRMMRRGGAGSHAGGRCTTGGGGGGGAAAGDTQSSPLAHGATATGGHHGGPGGGGGGVYAPASVTAKFHSGGVAGGRTSSGVSIGLMAGFSPGGSVRASDSNSTAATPPGGGGGGSDRSINSTAAVAAAAGGSAPHAVGMSSSVTSSNAGCAGAGMMFGTLGAVTRRSGTAAAGGGVGGGSDASGESSSAAPAGSNVMAVAH
ncbi:hypothetical protein HXX76_005711 [Chlamydomonas incerta]|uniref:Serine-threonine/tyrosine-protein kinase catalytic domain-containing protein n=1 Tax=Chlamydomonas incerta TaxID=51695 RepID=A0A835W2G2_CHLIN|nr:hypothetical protein HXX76_005711 [Chlamydomonas incerta]|eukprot:KAG2438102.1 hypothetical protein HXX76_005711 [Chlamydomonas incerta]